MINRTPGITERFMEGTMKRALVVLICIVLILVWGGMSALRMQRDYLPSINNTTLAVSLRASNVHAEQLAQNVTLPLRNAVNAVDGLQSVETSTFGNGLLMSLYFPMDYNMDKAQADVVQALNTVELPQNVKKPTVTRLTTSSFPILKYSLSGGKASADDTALRTTVPLEIANQLKTIPGVADVVTTGAGNKGYILTLRAKDMQAEGVTADDVYAALADELPSWPIGNISDLQQSIPVKVNGWHLSEQDIRSLPIKTKDGETVPLSKVADFVSSITDVKTVTRTNGEPSVTLDVIKSPSANISDVSKKVKERMRQIPEIRSGEMNSTLLLDREHDVNDSLRGLLREGLWGCLFSMLCVFFFFRNIRSTLLIAVSLPISLLATTAILKAMGVSLNILTISGLIVAMGRIVDDSIVILDNMVRKVHEDTDKPMLQRLVSGAHEMLPAIFASTATTIAVYVPIAMVGGIVSASFSGFAWSVVIALVISFFVAMLVIPTLGLMGWKGLTMKPLALESRMEPFVRLALARKKTVLFISIVLIGAAVAFAPFLPVNFLPSGTTGEIAVKLELPTGSPLSEVDREVAKVEHQLKQNPEVQSFSAHFGSNMLPQSDDVFDQGGGWIQQPNIANLSVTLKNKKHVGAVIQQLEKSLPALSDQVVYTVTNQNIAGDDSQVKITFTGADQQTLDRVASEYQGKLAQIKGLSVDGQANGVQNTKGYTITLNRDKLQAAGVRVEDVEKTLERYLIHANDIKIEEDHIPIPVDAYLDQLSQGSSDLAGSSIKDQKRILDQLKGETFIGNDGNPVRLDSIASFEPDTTPATIHEKDGLPYSQVSAQITSKDVSQVSGDIQAQLKALPLPKGVAYSLGGITEQVKQMIIDMAAAVMASILLVLLIISIVFKGWRAPLAVLVSVPLAISGVVLSLVVFHGSWSLAALIGVLMLTGIVVTNGIVLIDKMERNLAAGMPLQEAIVKGSLSRVRPIFMTAGTTILTLLPLALSHSGDTVISQTLGYVVIGGMITSTLNSFIVIPILYERMQRNKYRNAQGQADRLTLQR